jgi:hypothetical protein
MSISMYRNDVTRLTKEIAELRKQVGKENEKIARLNSDIISIQKSLTRGSNISVSTLNSKMQQINSKQKDASQCQKKVADLESRIANKSGDLSRKLASLESLENQERKRQDDAAKKRREEEKKHSDARKKSEDEALRRAREITKEIERQSRLHAEMKRNRFSIDLTKLPEKIKVIFFAANPIDQTQLRLDEEIRAIEGKIRASEHRDSVDLVSKWAVRPDDLLQALNQHDPHIVHFSGHGSDAEEIVFQDNEGATKLVTKNAIVQLFNAMAGNVRVIVFNTCFSAAQAVAVTQYIDVAIGMNDSIGDEAARVFAAQFYSAIGFGRSIGEAFDQAKVALMLENIAEDKTPVLFVREGIDPYDIVIVRP